MKIPRQSRREVIIPDSFDLNRFYELKRHSMTRKAAAYVCVYEPQPCGYFRVRTVLAFGNSMATEFP
jgi:hypothetical protein